MDTVLEPMLAFMCEIHRLGHRLARCRLCQGAPAYYDCAMISLSKRTISALRSASIALLLLGLVLNPLLAYMGDVHHLDHAAASSEIDVGHHYQIDNITPDNSSSEDDFNDMWHGLMHASHTHAAWETTFFVSLPALIPRSHTAVFPPVVSLSPRQHFVGPFRPPIA